MESTLPETFGILSMENSHCHQGSVLKIFLPGVPGKSRFTMTAPKLGKRKQEDMNLGTLAMRRKNRQKGATTSPPPPQGYRGGPGLVPRASLSQLPCGGKECASVLQGLWNDGYWAKMTQVLDLVDCHKMQWWPLEEAPHQEGAPHRLSPLSPRRRPPTLATVSALYAVGAGPCISPSPAHLPGAATLGQGVAQKILKNWNLPRRD